MSEQIDEQELVRLLNAMDNRAFRTLFEDYVPIVRTYLRKIRNDDHEIEEVICLTLEVLVIKARQQKIVLNEGAKLLNYLIGIARRIMLKRLNRKDYTIGLDTIVEDGELDEILGSFGNFSESDWEKVREHFRKVYAQISETCQQILDGFYFFGLSMRELAEEIYSDPTREDTVKKRKYKCLEQLRKKFFAGKPQ